LGNGAYCLPFLEALEVAPENHHGSAAASTGTEDEVVEVGAAVVGVPDFPAGGGSGGQKQCGP